MAKQANVYISFSGNIDAILKDLETIKKAANSTELTPSFDMSEAKKSIDVFVKHVQTELKKMNEVLSSTPADKTILSQFKTMADSLGAEIQEMQKKITDFQSTLNSEDASKFSSALSDIQQCSNSTAESVANLGNIIVSCFDPKKVEQQRKELQKEIDELQDVLNLDSAKKKYAESDFVGGNDSKIKKILQAEYSATLKAYKEYQTAMEQWQKKENASTQQRVTEAQREFLKHARTISDIYSLWDSYADDPSSSVGSYRYKNPYLPEQQAYQKGLGLLERQNAAYQKRLTRLQGELSSLPEITTAKTDIATVSVDTEVDVNTQQIKTEVDNAIDEVNRTTKPVQVEVETNTTKAILGEQGIPAVAGSAATADTTATTTGQSVAERTIPVVLVVKTTDEELIAEANKVISSANQSDALNDLSVRFYISQLNQTELDEEFRVLSENLATVVPVHIELQQESKQELLTEISNIIEELKAKCGSISVGFSDISAEQMRTFVDAINQRSATDSAAQQKQNDKDQKALADSYIAQNKELYSLKKKILSASQEDKEAMESSVAILEASLADKREEITARDQLARINSDDTIRQANHEAEKGLYQVKLKESEIVNQILNINQQLLEIEEKKISATGKNLNQLTKKAGTLKGQRTKALKKLPEGSSAKADATKDIEKTNTAIDKQKADAETQRQKQLKDEATEQKNLANEAIDYTKKIYQAKTKLLKASEEECQAYQKEIEQLQEKLNITLQLITSETELARITKNSDNLEIEYERESGKQQAKQEAQQQKQLADSYIKTNKQLYDVKKKMLTASDEERAVYEKTAEGLQQQLNTTLEQITSEKELARIVDNDTSLEDSYGTQIALNKLQQQEASSYQRILEINQRLLQITEERKALTGVMAKSLDDEEKQLNKELEEKLDSLTDTSHIKDAKKDTKQTKETILAARNTSSTQKDKISNYKSDELLNVAELVQQKQTWLKKITANEKEYEKHPEKQYLDEISAKLEQIKVKKQEVAEKDLISTADADAANREIQEIYQEVQQLASVYKDGSTLYKANILPSGLQTEFDALKQKYDSVTVSGNKFVGVVKNSKGVTTTATYT